MLQQEDIVQKFLLPERQVKVNQLMKKIDKSPIKSPGRSKVIRKGFHIKVNKSYMVIHVKVDKQLLLV